MPIARAEVNIRELLTEAAAAKAVLATDANVTLDLQLGDVEGVFAADRKRLTQAIGQVLDNAVRYNRNGGTVLLFARWQANDIEIIVADNGPGIGSASLSGTESVTRGLGLPLAKQLIESHGGTLTVETETGHGTTIIMSVPRA